MVLFWTMQPLLTAPLLTMIGMVSPFLFSDAITACLRDYTTDPAELQAKRAFF